MQHFQTKKSVFSFRVGRQGKGRMMTFIRGVIDSAKTTHNGGTRRWVSKLDKALRSGSKARFRLLSVADDPGGCH